MANASKTTFNEVEKIWTGSKKELQFDPKDSVGSIILKSLQQNPKGVGQISYTSGMELTNRDILLYSIRVAQHLRDLTMEQGEVVGICCTNSDYLACLVFGCLFRGLVISTMDASFHKDYIKHIYSITRPKLMFCDAAVYYKVKQALKECYLHSTVIYTVDDHLEGVPDLADFLAEIRSEQEFKCVKLKMGLNQLAAIQCSPGTTGLPKGVCVTHLSIMKTLILLHPSYKRSLCFSTLYWLSGLINLLTETVQNSTRIISAKPFTPNNFVDIVRKYKVNKFVGSPCRIGLLLSWPKLLQNDLNSLNHIIAVGNILPQRFIEKLRTCAPETKIFVVYGLTEVGPAVSFGVAKEEGNCGQLKFNMEVKIIDDNGKNLGPYKVGEICIRTTYQWPGYYGNSEATANVYDAERWIHSADLGYVSEKGDIYVIGRNKDILKYNGFHFHPTEIEALILELPDIVEVCVFGMPDIFFTNLPAAAIVKKPESKLTGDQIYQHVCQRKAHVIYLRGGVYFVNELPKTPSGKMLRRNISELCKNINNELEVKK